MHASTHTSNRRRTLAALWIGSLAGPLAWAFDAVVGYSAIAHECSTGSMFLLHSLTIATLVVCAGALVMAMSVWRSLGQSYELPTDKGRVRFMAAGGML